MKLFINSWDELYPVYKVVKINDGGVEVEFTEEELKDMKRISDEWTALQVKLAKKIGVEIPEYIIKDSEVIDA